jgi:hypothetical protein
MVIGSNNMRLVVTFLAFASLLGCVQADRVPFDPSKVGTKPESWKCFEAKLPMYSRPLSYCYGDGGECTEARSKFEAENPDASSVGMCGLETKAFCFQEINSAGDALRSCAKTIDECDVQAKGKANRAAPWVKHVSQCQGLTSTDPSAQAATAEPTPTTSVKAPIAMPSGPETAVPSTVPSATIRGVRTGYRRNRLTGNAKDGFTLTLFELEDPAHIKGEVNASIEGPLVKSKPMPVKMTFLQVADNGPRSMEGVRNISCYGKGTLVLDSVPVVPKPGSEPKEVGEAKGKVTIDVECDREEKEFGKFAISGPITATVVSAK